MTITNESIAALEAAAKQIIAFYNGVPVTPANGFGAETILALIARLHAAEADKARLNRTLQYILAQAKSTAYAVPRQALLVIAANAEMAISNEYAEVHSRARAEVERE